MPTPPASLTTLDFSMRGLTPRWHRTILPVTLLEARESGKQRWASAVVTPVAAAPAASTISVLVGSAAVIDEPEIVPTPWSMVAVPRKVRASVAAPTEGRHGAR